MRGIDDARSASDLGQRPAPPSEEELSAHEIGHAQAMAENLVQEQLKTREDAEKTAGDFAKKVNDQKKTVSEEEAEKKVREILGLPSQEERKNKK
ncbi:MAG: hypothetical protein DMF63_07325 [Acidobacteria bacterium]|nr:MAG: hypothetical protein DMF63_07325 [Acidobacteriota bacterium]